MPTARRTELPTRKTVSLRSGVPGSGVGGIFQLIYSTIANVDRDDEREFLTAEDDDGEGKDSATRTRLTTEFPCQLIAFPIRTPAHETSDSSTSSEINTDVTATGGDGEPLAQDVQPRGISYG